MDIKKYLGGDISVYVGTYKKYNEGSIKGAWVNMEAVRDVDQFWRICHTIHKESDPEFMFQDHQGFPEWLYSESMGSKEIAEILRYAHADEKERARIACEDDGEEPTDSAMSLAEVLRVALLMRLGKSATPKQVAKADDKALLEEYMAEWLKVYPKDKSMLDYHRKKWSGGVRLQNGGIVCFTKPRIETRFCFGYSSCGQGPEYDEANAACRAASTESYFLQKNLSCMDEQIRALECNCRYPQGEYSHRYDGHVWYVVRESYSGQSAPMNVYSFEAIRPWDMQEHPDWYGEAEKMSDADRRAILAGMRREREKFEKRLRTYLKRYGTSKLITWTYWMDE